MKKTRVYLLLLAAALMVLLTAGVSYAWLSRQEASMDTLLSILPPDTIVIIPVSEEGGSALPELDLDYHAGSNDYIENGTIHILRPVCVKSSYPAHRLEVVRTTNLENLTFNIYPAPWDKDANAFALPVPDQRTALSGSYLNLAEGYDETPGTPKLAAPDNALNKNYQTGDEVEAHAYPLYWLATKTCKHGSVESDTQQRVTSKVVEEIDPHVGEKRDFYYTYYYLEISWKEDTKKTDLFYILAHNVAE